MKALLDVAKARKLKATYRRKQPAKAKILEELISWQLFFGGTTIVETKISLNRKYQKRTIYEVLTELGYTNITIENVKEHEYTSGDVVKTITQIIFS